jgi:AraC-like DNA-binding protein
MQAAIERAIDTMWARYHEPLSLADIADTAILSKFYFSRVFRNFTGTSPGRFLTAIRLSKAKQLLLETSLSVAEISYMVGYNSLGTFTSRFTHSVGVSPARYRALSQVGIPSLSAFSECSAQEKTGSVYGWVEVPETGTPVRVYLGAFEDPVVQGAPVACDILSGSGPYRLDAVSEGRYHLRVAVVAVRDLDPLPWNRRPLFVGSTKEIGIKAGRNLEVDITTRPAGTLDLPILLALPELDSRTVPDPELAEPSRVRG